MINHWQYGASSCLEPPKVCHCYREEVLNENTITTQHNVMTKYYYVQCIKMCTSFTHGLVIIELYTDIHTYIHTYSYEHSSHTNATAYTKINCLMAGHILKDIQGRSVVTWKIMLEGPEC